MTARQNEATRNISKTKLIIRQVLGDKALDYILPIYRWVKRLAKRLTGREPYFAVHTQVPAIRLGTEYGGWWICPCDLGSESVVYSFGIGDDVSFDVALIERYGSTVHGFDPTPYSIQWVSAQALPTSFVMHPFGIGVTDDDINLYTDKRYGTSLTIQGEADARSHAVNLPVSRLSTIARELGHSTIDLLKMDIEGAEYDVIPDILCSNISIHQLIVEFHHEKYGAEKTRKSVRMLIDCGFSLFYVSDTGTEYSFIYQSQ